LLLVASGGFLWFFGLGALVVVPVLNSRWSRAGGEVSLARVLPLTILWGVIVNFLLVLALESLDGSFRPGAVLCVAGLVLAVVQVLRMRREGRRLEAGSRLRWLAMGLLTLVYLVPILTEPLRAWDARTIWFLHAKMIHVSGTIGQSAGWNEVLADTFHPDYPKLIPAMAAQVAHLGGYWNEYLPKLSLFFLLVPAAGLLFAAPRLSVAFALLVIAFPFLFGEQLWNGYMDGYLAIYFCLSMLYAGEWLRSSRPVDLFTAFSCLLILPNLKNEGLLGLVAGLIALAGAVVASGSIRSLFRDGWARHHLVTLAAGIAGAAPVVLWAMKKRQWGLSSDLGIGTAESFGRMIDRLQDGSLLTILGGLFRHVEGGLMLVGFLAVVLVVRRIKPDRAYIPALVGGGIFLLGLVLAYLLTPYDLAWHVGSSSPRTVFSVSGTLFVAAYFLSSRLESREAASEQSVGRPDR
jgi:hypothetical protein